MEAVTTASSPPPVVPVAVTVEEGFARHDYEALLRQLAEPGAKLLDLRAARAVRPSLFTALATNWHPDPELVPRLAIVLRFDQWAVLRISASMQLAPLYERGVEAELFYAEQAYDGQLRTWFEHGSVKHNVAAVLSTLRRWQPSPLSPVVLDAVAALVYEAVANGAPVSLIIELASGDGSNPASQGRPKGGQSRSVETSLLYCAAWSSASSNALSRRVVQVDHDVCRQPDALAR